MRVRCSLTNECARFRAIPFRAQVAQHPAQYARLAAELLATEAMLSSDACQAASSISTCSMLLPEAAAAAARPDAPVPYVAPECELKPLLLSVLSQAAGKLFLFVPSSPEGIQYSADELELVYRFLLAAGWTKPTTTKFWTTAQSKRFEDIFSSYEKKYDLVALLANAQAASAPAASAASARERPATTTAAAAAATASAARSTTRAPTEAASAATPTITAAADANPATAQGAKAAAATARGSATPALARAAGAHTSTTWTSRELVDVLAKQILVLEPEKDNVEQDHLLHEIDESLIRLVLSEPFVFFVLMPGLMNMIESGHEDSEEDVFFDALVFMQALSEVRSTARMFENNVVPQLNEFAARALELSMMRGLEADHRRANQLAGVSQILLEDNDGEEVERREQDNLVRQTLRAEEDPIAACTLRVMNDYASSLHRALARMKAYHDIFDKMFRTGVAICVLSQLPNLVMPAAFDNPVFAQQKAEAFDACCHYLSAAMQNPDYEMETETMQNTPGNVLRYLQAKEQLFELAKFADRVVFSSQRKVLLGKIDTLARQADALVAPR